MPNPYTDIINTSEDRSITDLSSIPAPLHDDDIIGFGAYSNRPLNVVPISYFEWMVTEMKTNPRVARSARWTQVIAWLKSKAV